MTKRILIFAPFGAWRVHHQLDAVLGAALRLRGCEVRVLACDGVFEGCYVAGNPFNPAVCSNCARSAVELFGQFQLPVTQLRSLLSDSDFREASAWADSVPATDYLTAIHEDAPLGQWTALAMHSYFKTSRLDPGNEEVAQMGRNLLYNGVLIQRAYRKFRAEFIPDRVLCFSASHAYYRVFFELCRRDGVDVLVHERGFTDNSFQLVSNEPVYSIMEVADWAAWGKAPLTLPQLGKVRGLMADREQNRNTNFQAVHNFISADADLRRALRIPADAPILALFCSGDWEFGMFRSFGGLLSTFASQEEWMRVTAQICAAEGWYLVIRHHPLGAGRAAYPRADAFLSELFQFNRTLGQHVRVIMPAEKISSYDLIWNTDAAVTVFSTVGAEAMTRGVAAVCVAESIYKPMGLEWVRDAAAYPQALREAMRRTREFGVADLRRVYRYMHFIYFVAFSDKFKAFGIRNNYEADIRVSGVEELAVGTDAVLDRVCNHILTGAPLYAPPSTDGDEGDESRWLVEELQSIQTRRARVREATADRIQPEEPLANVFLTCSNDAKMDGESVFERSLRRSRHRRMEIAPLPFGPAQAPGSFIEALAGATARAAGDFAYVGTEWTDLDESALSTAIDAMTAPTHARCDGVVLGVYGCTAAGALVGELFTELHDAEDFADAVRQVPALAHPAQLLSVVVWRIAALRRLAAEWREGRFVSSGDLSADMFQRLVSPTAAFHRLNVPTVTFYEFPSRPSVVDESGLQRSVENGATLAQRAARSVQVAVGKAVSAFRKLRRSGAGQPEPVTEGAGADPVDCANGNKLLIGPAGVGAPDVEDGIDEVPVPPIRANGIELPVPAITVPGHRVAAKAVNRGLQLLREGRAAKALCWLEAGALVAAPPPPGLHYARALAKAQLGRLSEARLAAEAEIFARPGDLEAWQLLRHLLPQLLGTRPEYASIAPAVESVEGYLVPGQEKYLFDKVHSLPHDAVILEIGGYLGRSTVAMAFACAGTQRRIFTIDTFFGNDGPMGRSESFLNVWRGNLARFDLERYATPLSGYSHERLPGLRGKLQVDFAFVDGSHEYADVLRDLELLYPVVKEGGWIAFHDVEPGWPGSWRVWRQTGRRLLEAHEYCHTIACGRKVSGRGYQSFVEEGYSYGGDWAEHLQTQSGDLQALTDAMLWTARAFNAPPVKTQPVDPVAAAAAEAQISQMPENVKQTLGHMLAKDACGDGLLSYWNALVLRREGALDPAVVALRQALVSDGGGLRPRMEKMLAGWHVPEVPRKEDRR